MKKFKINFDKENGYLSFEYQGGTLMHCTLTDGGKGIEFVEPGDMTSARELREMEFEVKDDEKLVILSCGLVVIDKNMLVIGKIDVDESEDKIQLNAVVPSCLILGIQALSMNWDPSLMKELGTTPFGDVRIYE